MGNFLHTNKRLSNDREETELTRADDIALLKMQMMARKDVTAAEWVAFVRAHVLDLSQVVFADKLGISRRTLINIERGESEPSITVFNQVLATIGCHLAVTPLNQPLPVFVEPKTTIELTAMHPCDFIYTCLHTHLSFVPWQVVAPGQKYVCAICERPSSQWAHQIFVDRQNSYDASRMEQYCAGCYAFVAADDDFLGTEMSAAGLEAKAKAEAADNADDTHANDESSDAAEDEDAKPKRFSGKHNRLGMLAGASAIISNGQSHLMVAKGYYDKIARAKNNPFALHAVQPKEVVSLARTLDISYPAILIRGINRNTKDLVGNLVLSTGPDDIWWCSAGMSTPYSFTLAQRIEALVKDTPKPAAKGLLKAYALVAKGFTAIDSDKTKKAESKAPELAQKLRGITDNPLLKSELFESVEV